MKRRQLLSLLPAFATMLAACAEGKGTPPPDVVQMSDAGPVDVPMPRLKDVELEEMRRELTAVLEETNGDLFGKLNASIENVKIGGNWVVRYDAKGSRGARVLSFNGVANGQRRVVQCISLLGKIPADCDSKVQQAFASTRQSGAN